MADGIEIKIDTHEVDEWLTTLEPKVRRRAVRQSLQKGADLILASMKALCPVATVEPDSSSNALQPGVLQESLTTQVQMSKNYNPRVKVGAPIETAHVAWWIENGFDSFKAHRGETFYERSF